MTFLSRTLPTYNKRQEKGNRAGKKKQHKRNENFQPNVGMECLQKNAGVDVSKKNCGRCASVIDLRLNTI